MDLIFEVKKKREFRELPDSIVKRVISGIDTSDSKEAVKEARKLLRKYFGVFLTNKILKPKDVTDYKSVLSRHKSSAKRNYSEFYDAMYGVFDKHGGKGFESIIDLGSGVNGFSYSYLENVFGKVYYTGVEGSGQVVKITNEYFKESRVNAKANCVWGDLFDLGFIESVLKKSKKGRLVFLFQVVDSLENLEENFSKKFLKVVKNHSEYIVLSFPLESLSGKTKFAVRRNWIMKFLEEHFEILDDVKMFGERFIFLKC